MKNLYTWVAAFLFVALAISVMACTSASSAGTVTVVDRPDIHAVNLIIWVTVPRFVH